MPETDCIVTGFPSSGEKTMIPAVRLKQVVFRFWQDGKRNVLDHVSLDIMPGKITVVMGASGCGKSTLAAVADGLYPENGGYLEQGEIELFGHRLQDLDPAERARLVTMMFQNPDLQFCMDTLRSEMRFCLENLRVPPEEMDDRIEKTAEEMRVTHLLDRKLVSLSGGEKQKATLCCLTCMQSRCLMLDEPFANIDPEDTQELIGMLMNLRKKGVTIIAIDHRPENWMNAADEVILLGQGGKTVRRGITPETISQYEAVFAEQGVFFPKARNKAEHGKMANENAVVLENVSIPVQTEKKRWLRPAVQPLWLMKNASASFPKGCITAILGKSGCGKTTLFRALLKAHPYTGRMMISGCDLAKMKQKDLYRQVGIVFQNPANQFVTQNVLEQVRVSLKVWQPDLADEECMAKAVKLLEDYGLEKQKRYSPYMLSQGQQRRLAVLSVLAGNQKILLLDEPTYGQDARSTGVMMQQLKRKMAQQNLTVIMITHDADLANEYADRIYDYRHQHLEAREE